MTYASGSLIQATDYNTFVSNVNTTWNSFYGQSALSQAAATGNPVTAAQWTTLFNTITNMAAHSNTTLTPSLPSVSAGTTISALANVATAISNCATNQLNAASQGSQYTGWTGTASYTTGFTSLTANWTITYTDTVTFANTTAATNFFNCGGTIAVAFSKTSTGQTGDSTWNTFVGNGASSAGTCGTIYLSGSATSKTIAGVAYTGTTKRNGSGSPTTLTTGTGYNNLTSSPTTIFKQFLTAAGYTSGYVQVNASVSGAVLTLTTTWYDASTYSISGGTATSGVTYGTAPTTTVTYYPPETTYITSNWGTPTVASSVSGTFTPGAAPPSSQSYTTAGTYTWVAPASVNKVSVVAVGGGGGGQWGFSATGGGGGGLGWTNNISVTPGSPYTVVVGVGGDQGRNPGQYAGGNGGTSYFINTPTVYGGGAQGGGQGSVGGSHGGGGGGNGGAGAGGSGDSNSGGGGGAGGYSGNGGNGNNGGASQAGSGGAGGGGNNQSQPVGLGGGGVGLLGQGTSGAAANCGQGGFGGSGGAPANGCRVGGLYGGGAGGGPSPGAGGAVRIVWPGCSRVFPSTSVGNP